MTCASNIDDSVCFSVCFGWYLDKLSSGWALLPLLRSQRKEAESREERAEDEELRLG